MSKAFYTKSYQEATALGESQQYTDSIRETRRCVQELESFVGQRYDANRWSLSATVGKELIKEFGKERIVAVLASIVNQKSWDGRISPQVKEWAEKVPVPSDHFWGRVNSDLHPGLLNNVCKQVQKELEQNRGQKQGLASRLDAAKSVAATRNATSAPTHHQQQQIG